MKLRLFEKFSDGSGRMVTNEVSSYLRIDSSGNMCHSDSIIPLISLGHLDKNGKQIFQSDIVKSFSQDDGFLNEVVVLENSTLSLQNPNKLSWSLSDYKPDDLEVIGNIFENTDLLP